MDDILSFEQINACNILQVTHNLFLSVVLSGHIERFTFCCMPNFFLHINQSNDWIKGCSHIMSAKNGGVQTPPSAKNQKKAAKVQFTNLMNKIDKI